jgi:hypothetical protein
LTEIGAAAASHTHNLITFQDTRSDNFTPFTMDGLSYHLKFNTTDGLNDGGVYHGVMHIAQWPDISGGKPHQLGLTDNNNLYIRSAIDASTWGSWEKLSKEGHTHSNYTPFASNSQTIPMNTPSGAWYRIAASAVNVGRCDGIFELEYAVSGYHQRVSFRASSMFNSDNSIQIVKMGGSKYDNSNVFPIQSVRVVYHPNTYSSQYAYVEVFVTNPNTTDNATLYVRMVDAIGWGLTTGAGSIPTYYTAKELRLKNCNPLYSTEEKKNTINPTSGVLNLDFSLPNRMLVSTNITQNTTINISNLYDGAVGTILLYLSGTYSITLGTMTNDVSASITKHTVGSYSNLQTGFYTLTYYVIIDHNSIWRIFFNISPKYS